MQGFRSGLTRLFLQWTSYSSTLMGLKCCIYTSTRPLLSDVRVSKMPVCSCLEHININVFCCVFPCSTFTLFSLQFVTELSILISALFYQSSIAILSAETMRIHQLLPLASLALAMPHSASNTKRQFATPCGISETWTINQYHTCTNCTYPGSTQETTSLSFKFIDPNFNPPVTATCELSLLPGSSLIQPFDYTQCGSGVAFYYDGADLEVERTGVQCGK